MSIHDPYVLVSENADGSADFTISVDDNDHKFSAVADGDSATLSYEETLTWRGQIRVAEPNEEIVKLLIQSDQMTMWLESNDLNEVRRIRQ